MLCEFCVNYLHSTMFLLILVPVTPDAYSLLFTFHNVSINSLSFLLFNDSALLFTFHNVSINSQSKKAIKQMRKNLHSTMFLLIQDNDSIYERIYDIYIPQCFY